MATGNIVTPPGPPRGGEMWRVFDFSGRLTYGPTSEERYQELRADIGSGARHFVFDLSRVPDVDSAGIGFLVECLTTVRRAGGGLSLAAPSERVLHSLLLTRLDGLFPVFETVEAALGKAC